MRVCIVKESLKELAACLINSKFNHVVFQGIKLLLWCSCFLIVTHDLDKDGLILVNENVRGGQSKGKSGALGRSTELCRDLRNSFRNLKLLLLLMSQRLLLLLVLGRRLILK